MPLLTPTSLLNSTAKRHLKKRPLILGLLMLTSLLTACSSWFQPTHKTIEYDEEVKLHNGEMIWVHITRHYRLVGGGALGDPGAFEKGYMPSTVEISWDTGFEGVGRKSVFFDDGFEFIDKYQKKWYVSGGMIDESNIKRYGYKGIGNRSKHTAYLYVIDENGNFLINHSRNELPNESLYNILDLRGLKNISNPPIELENKELSWQRKIDMRKTQSTYGNYFGKSVKTN